jgi:hypothetical protein
MGYCCAKGMKLAEFHTKAEYDEVLKAPISWDSRVSFNVFIDLKLVVKNILSRGWYLYIGPTYDNGDKTDTWSQSRVLVPAGLISFTEYAISFGESETKYALAPEGIVKGKKIYTMNMFLCFS